MVNSAVEVSGLRVIRGRKEVLTGLDFTVRAGSVTGLLGPSGCGKTTLMRAVVGTQRISSGRVGVLGRPAGDRALRAEVGYSSQAASVYPDLTVAENVRYFGAALRAPIGDAQRVLDAVDMSRHADRLTAQLSGGERSRVSLAVALLGRPRLLVLDEPTVGLDPVLREQLWTLFGELTASGMTLVVSSHVMVEAERCDELLLMRAGALLAQATAAELKTRTGTESMDAAFLTLVTAGSEIAP